MMSAIEKVDVIVIGAGIAGVGIAAQLGSGLRVVVLEQEAQPGYHTTGRSAAVFAECYGGSTVRQLSRGSRAFFEHPPDGFSAHRSEERLVGKECVSPCRSRGSTDHSKKKNK